MFTQSQKRADVWVSVVIYTMIGITAIGLLLVAIQPRVKEARDSITIKQTIEALHNFDSALRSTLIAPGNKRQVEFKLSAGELRILSSQNKIVWEMQSAAKYSEPGFLINEGTIQALTKEGSPWKVTLSLNYTGVSDITFNSREENKIFPKAGRPYILSIENLGTGDEDFQNVNIRLRE